MLSDAGCAFPKSRRLLRRKDFRRVYDTGTPYRNAGFHLFVKPREESGPSRLGLTVTRHFGKAVIRNRIRRWARETFRLRASQIEPGYDLALNFHPTLAGRERQEFDRLFEDVLRKAHLLKSC